MLSVLSKQEISMNMQRLHGTSVTNGICTHHIFLKTTGNIQTTILATVQLYFY
jgi:hypothetical protein